MRSHQEAQTVSTVSTASDPTIAAAVETAKGVRFGAPGKCPVCGEPGFLDYVDIKRGVSDSSCKSCRVAWNYTRGADGWAILVEA